MKPIQVVLMVFYDYKTKKVLSELRAPDHPFYPNQKTFPTGKVDEVDKAKNCQFHKKIFIV